MTKQSLPLTFVLYGLLGAAAYAQMPGQSMPEISKVIVTQRPRGLDATIGKERLHVTVCSDSIIHVVGFPDASEPSHPKPWIMPADQSCNGAHSTFVQDEKQVTLKTDKLMVTLNLERGNLRFLTSDGKSLTSESDSVPRTYTPEVSNGEQTMHVVDRFRPDSSEGFYGLGQHQSGMFNYRGSTVELGQNNTDIAIPFLVSSKGYGIIWNTASFTYVDNRFPIELSFDSLAGTGIDYYVVYGPEMDDIIHQYRTLTGHAPMLPRWSYGFIQSKDRYISTEELLTVANRYRAEHIPLDAIVQDWFWWKTEGDPYFNANYHDVPADLKKLHEKNVHTMISTWGLIDPHAETYKKLDEKNLFVPHANVYDASSPEAREIYWNSLTSKLFKQGWDSFWLDSAEPEEFWPHMGDAILRDKKIAIGNGAEYTNIYPLLHNEGIQQHWRQTNDQKRVFLLTRSAFLGSQRVGGTVWSGDVYSSYWALAHQVAGGLNYSLTGLPYWTTDIGGYHAGEFDGKTDTAAYQELYLRWFEFGVFCPVFRTHGHRPHNELWSYPQIESTLIQYDKLRYRMMPYIYSLAWKVSHDDYTLQRPLVMDWREDPKVRSIADQFMFGPAMLVNPVIEANATTRRIYLPAAQHWYNFWTGETQQGGTYLDAAAPADRIPLFVRSGSILPLGPNEEYAGEKPNGPVELRIYPGADGHFDLYQDEGDNYNYENGKHSIIPIIWNDTTQKLSFGARQGSYAGMPKEMVFHVVYVHGLHGAGPDVTVQPDKTITYDGAAITN